MSQGAATAGGMLQRNSVPAFREPCYDEVETVAPSCPSEQLSDIHAETIKVLCGAHGNLAELLIKLRGSQPNKAGIANDKVPERSMLSDARRMRELAHDIIGQTAEIHHIVGPNK